VTSSLFEQTSSGQSEPFLFGIQCLLIAHAIDVDGNGCMPTFSDPRGINGKTSLSESPNAEVPGTGKETTINGYIPAPRDRARLLARLRWG
jgi:hypothetical protein